MTEDPTRKRQRRRRLAAYVAIVLALAGGVWRIEDRASVAKAAALVARVKADETKRLAEQNRTDLAEMKADRAARIVARCEQDHNAFLAAQQAYAAQQATFDLIDGLLHQSAPDDPIFASLLTPDQLQFLRDERAKSEALLADARLKVDTARSLVTQTDCSQRSTP